jgi:hypothetical protein
MYVTQHQNVSMISAGTHNSYGGRKSLGDRRPSLLLTSMMMMELV